MTLPGIFGMPPLAALEYFRNRGYTPSWNWEDTWASAHATAFTVAKAMQLDVLDDIRAAVDKAMATGQSFREFQNNLAPLLKEKGWWGRQTIDGQNVQLGSSRRLWTILDTNIRTSYAAGRWHQQMEEAADRPYLMYLTVGDSRVRDSHAALHGLTLPADDPFWQTHYPPNEWGCRCRVRSLTQKQYDIMIAKGDIWIPKSMSLESRPVVLPTGESKPDETTAHIITADGTRISSTPGRGWSYNPGAAAYALDARLWNRIQRQPQQTFEQMLSTMATAKTYDISFATWADTVIKRRTSIREERTVGWLTPEIWREVIDRGIPVSSPILTMNDRGLLHVLRTAKELRGSAITTEEVRQIPALLQHPDAVLFDRDDSALIFIRKTGSRYTKYVVKIPPKEGGRLMVTTAGVIKKENLNATRYQVINGSV